MEIMQGDAYRIPLHVMLSGESVAPDNIVKLEATIGGISKLFPDDITYDEERDRYMMPLTQEDTFTLKGTAKFQTRVQIVGGDVIGKKLEDVTIIPSISKRVL